MSGLATLKIRFDEVDIVYSETEPGAAITYAASDPTSLTQYTCGSPPRRAIMAPTPNTTHSNALRSPHSDPAKSSLADQVDA